VAREGRASPISLAGKLNEETRGYIPTPHRIREPVSDLRTCRKRYDLEKGHDSRFARKERERESENKRGKEEVKNAYSPLDVSIGTPFKIIYNQATF